ncbi:unnamed protein product [Nezara viridula]|uniref:Uncharacterized protein n=1 Tax=Nezara viridula TaxID=85310 RepID=A0A9P0H2V4_NEZVI|nr:unnamed protein product [Nezara viridula]
MPVVVLLLPHTRDFYQLPSLDPLLFVNAGSPRAGCGSTPLTDSHGLIVSSRHPQYGQQASATPLVQKEDQSVFRSILKNWLPPSAPLRPVENQKIKF